MQSCCAYYSEMQRKTSFPFAFLSFFRNFAPMEERLLNKYLEEIGREKLLTADEEQQLSARVLKGDQRAVNRLVEANLRLVVAVA